MRPSQSEMLQELEATESAPFQEGERRVTLLDIFIILAKRKWIWIISALVCGILAFIIASLLPVEYRAETDIMPPEQAVSSAALLMGQVGNALSLGGHGLGAKDPNDIFLALLRSRTTAEALVKRFDLEKVYKRPDLVLAEIELGKRSTIVTTLEGTIAVIVEDRSPARAAAIANGYVEELNKRNNNLALTEAGRRQQFFDAQLENEKNALEEAEVALKQTQLRTGVLALPNQTEQAIRLVAGYRAQITNRELALKDLLTVETPGNPDIARMQQQIAALKQNLQKVEGDPSQSDTEVGKLTTSTVPGLAIEYVRKLREVKYHEELFNMLSRQDEAARMDEAKESPAVEVIDAAVPPHFKSWPKTALLVEAGVALGLILGWVYVIMFEMVRRSLQEPANAMKWAVLKKAARVRI